MADKTLRFLLLGEDKTASKAIKGVGTQADQTGRKLKGFGTGVGKMGAAIKGGIIGMAISAVAGEVIDFGKASVDAFQDAEKSQRLLTDAYKRFPAVQDVSIAKMREYNTEIQKKTGADADDLAASQAVLARYKLTGTELQNLTPLLVDYATRTGKELPAAAGTLGKAMMGNGRAMKELGINFKDTGDPAKNLKQIMAGLSSSVGGYATTVAGTAEGKTKILTTRFGDMQEQIGQKLMPVMEGLLDMGMGLMDWLDQNPKVLAGASAAWDLLVMAFQGLAEVARIVLLPSLIMTGKALSWLVGGIGDMLSALGEVPGFEWAKEAGEKLKGVKTAVDGVVAGLEDLAKQKPKPTVDAKDAASAKIKSINDKIRALKGKVVEAKAKGDTKEVDRLKAKINALRNKRVTVQANVVKTGISTIRVQAMRGASDRVSVRAYASGGRPKVGQLAMFHADELWVPDTAGTVLTKAQTRRAIGSGPTPMGGAGGGVVNISVQGDTDPDAAARRIEDMLYRRRNRAGRLKFQ